MEKENLSSGRGLKIILIVLFGIILAAAIGLVVFIVFFSGKSKDGLVLTVTQQTWSGFAEKQADPVVTEYKDLKEGLVLYDDTYISRSTDENGNEVTEMKTLFGVVKVDQVNEDSVLLKIQSTRFYLQPSMRQVESLEIKIGESATIVTGMMDLEIDLTFELK